MLPQESNNSAPVTAVPIDEMTRDKPTLKYLMGGNVCEFVKCLQDPGKPKGPQKILDFSTGVLSKFSQAVAKRLFQYDVPGMPTHKTRLKQDITTAFVNARKQFARGQVSPEFQPFATSDGHVLLITNEKECAGFNVALSGLMIMWLQKNKSTSVKRNKNDGLQVGCILLQEKHRAGLQVVLSGKLDREQQDQAGTSSQGFWETIQMDFCDASLKFDQLSDKDTEILDDKDLDPNDVSLRVLLVSCNLTSLPILIHHCIF